jgi:hypothetical protein
MVRPVLPDHPQMRITDDRYHRERLRMEVALRFLRHEARTQTIRACTGLSDDRIRKLYRSYLDDARGELPRHRGKSPHQIAFFTRSLRLQEETLALATPLWLLGVLSTGAAAQSPGSLAALGRGTLLCEAFEYYRGARPDAQISFEHAVFLASALSGGELLRIGWCSACGGLMVTEPFSLRIARCPHCAGAARC